MRVFPAFVPLAFALAATTAAAQTAAAPTPPATPAPRYQAFDLGTHHRAVSTSNADAQKAFDQGLLWSFSFNHGDAERAFREAARLDDTLAAAWWGIALVNGPHINNTTVDTQAFNPAIRVDASGNIAVTHYDFRNDTKASVPLETDVWSLRSNDGGTTWHEERVTPTSFDMRQAPVARGFFIGDYIGTAAAGATFTPFFSQAGPTDTYSATVTGPLGETVITPTPSPAGLTAASFPIPKGRPTPA